MVHAKKMESKNSMKGLEKQRGRKLLMVTIHILCPVDVVVQCFYKGFLGKVLLKLLQGPIMKGFQTLSLKEVLMALLFLTVPTVEEIMRENI